MKRLLFSILLAVLATSASADIDARFIGENYFDGVVKVILYDSDLVEKFDLTDDSGQLSRGSGFFVTPDGVIFTNRHVIEWCVDGYVIADWVNENGDLQELDVLTYRKDIESDPSIKKIYYAGHAIPVIQVFDTQGQDEFHLYIAKVLSMGENFDGAVLKIVSDLDDKPVRKEFKALPLGNSDLVGLGETVVVLGFPVQYSQTGLDLDLKDTITLSRGENSGWDYVFEPGYGMMKTDAAIHEGNSGGPVFGDGNKVIGIATALGLQTSIGLIGPINVMYWIVKPVTQVFDQLVKLGLDHPKKGKEPTVVSGDPKPIPLDASKFSTPIITPQSKEK